MATCACARWLAPLENWSDVKTRIASSALGDLLPTLDVDVEGAWVAAYRCRVCGQSWAKEFPFGEMHGGGPPCLYAIETEDPRGWVAEGPGIPSRFRQGEEDRAFFDGLGEERPHPRCAAPNCPRGAILHGVFCRVHHFEMIKGKPCPFAR
jgi:hypothetical protein